MRTYGFARLADQLVYRRPLQTRNTITLNSALETHTTTDVTPSVPCTLTCWDAVLDVGEGVFATVAF